MMHKKIRTKVPTFVFQSFLFVAGILCGYGMRNLQRQKPKQRKTVNRGMNMSFPTAMDRLQHSEMIKDYMCQRTNWQLSSVKLFAGGKTLSEATSGVVKSIGTSLRLQVDKPMDAVLLDTVARDWIAGRVITADIQPQITGLLEEGVQLQADFPPNVSDFELTAGIAILLTSCKLESQSPIESERTIFGYLTGLPDKFKSRRISARVEGIDLFIFAVGGRDDYCCASIDSTCAATVEEVAEAVEFALSLFFGTTVGWRTLTTVDQNREKSWFSRKELHQSTAFPSPVENSSALSDDDVAKIIHTFLQYHLQKGYSAANYFMHQCWELSPSTQLSARVLTAAVAIEGICRSVLLAMKKEPDVLFEDIYKQIEDVTDSWVAATENEDEVSTRRNIKKRISDLLGKRNELSGKALIERTFAQIQCPISSNELTIWNSARNATAHAAFKRKSPSQEILDQYFTCVALLYRFILTNMGYHGSYIDYTSNSWPNATM
jgi:hypothetical protein